MNQTDTPDPIQSEYGYYNAVADHLKGYLWDDVIQQLERFFQSNNFERRVFDVGCGNGSLMAHLSNIGYDVTGIDPSKSGIEAARKEWPTMKTFVGSAYDDLASTYGTFPAVVSLEVVEHLYSPRDYVKSIYQLLMPGGVAIISTPYHGYWKNLALAISGKMDNHFHALWDHGHIKFWSIRTLNILLQEAGFECHTFLKLGRFPLLAKSMMAIAHKPR